MCFLVNMHTKVSPICFSSKVSISARHPGDAKTSSQTPTEILQISASNYESLGVANLVLNLNATCLHSQKELG